jgi:hypothetical protein
MPQNLSYREPVLSAYLSWGNPLTDPALALGALHFDVVISEEHTRAAEVTDHTVETGIAITDHVRPLADVLELEVFVSETPIQSSDAYVGPLTLQIDQAGGFSSPLGPIGVTIGAITPPGSSYPTTITAQAMQFDTEHYYVNAAYETMTRLRDTATICSVITPKENYFNMVIARIEMHRDSSTGTSARFRLDMKQVRTVASNIVSAPLPSISRASNIVNNGKKDPSAPDPRKQDVMLQSGLQYGKGPSS